MTEILFDEAQFMASLADDEELARELLTAFLEDSPQRVSNLQEAIEAGESKGAAVLAHSLKGMCGVVRATSLAEIALTMERKARDGQMADVSEQFDGFVEMHARVIAKMEVFMARG